MINLREILCASVLLLASVNVFGKSSLLSEECLDEISWPDPTNCSRYYVCAPWGPQIMECSGELQYNPELRVCDWPDAVGCVITTVSTEEPSTIPSTTPVSEPTGTTEAEPTSTPEPGTESPLPEPTGPPGPESTEAPESTTSEPELSSVGTESTPVPEPEPTETGPPAGPTTEGALPTDICKENSELAFVTSYPDECKKFIFCIFGETNILSCPDDFVYSTVLHTCTTDLSHCT